MSTPVSPVADSTALARGLKTRHLTMMGLGSAIGAGLFLGTGVGIAAAGPAVILAYIVAGFITVCFMQMLAEMVAARPSSGTFSIYAEQAYGRWAGFAIGWLYWFMMIMIMAVEITGASAIVAHWFGISPWIPALAAIAVFTVINFAAVKNFGEFEFWFALIKVLVIVAFLCIGAALWLGLLPSGDFIGLTNVNEVGFMPHGWAGVATALLAVAFAFGGIELVTVAAAESENPEAGVHSAIRSIIWRISVFYIGSVLLIILLLPFDQIGGADSAAESPFTAVLEMANIPGAVGIMEAVIVVALLSACNTQIYGSSRFLQNLAVRGDAPQAFAQTDSRGVPVRAVVVSVFFGFVAVALQYWNPPGLLAFLLNAVGGCLIVLWIAVALSFVRLHPKLVENGEITDVRMWAPNVLPWIMVALTGGVILLMLSNPDGRFQMFAVAVVVGIISLAGVLWTRKPEGRTAN
ncbi:amino acid permease [Corynebacterium tuscaniense]|uniref:Amino acid permease n=1 Tax=Corynebacterium tuscaniense TaxID=302449 RepID=A0A2N6T7Z3_9CORY|nr:amino acid permease [Corynebacterium tuscaniense]KAA8733667.1 amino acid permease [Corynebacterium tuscaniense]KGF24377.1 amino acid transporter [Corynebacterium tuscaniense DNF00037]PMC65450.1 amino acid permease [Corynebacterium tuscaniense]